ncbi:IclR family transcriptional regulator [Corynebacterium striatum]|uniref:IclR family transcriptional regulator n=1 Tax=Corynebacterium striatum TaxID=43770 RepID=UPI000D76C4F6|nr:IclR family transcriptional regulator [Corynebacterium striatum]PXY04771.1 IclR family transcriptional regulator [Corynebacterium striatum]HAT1211695.1 IclR family transcriptional regulator [Corynebacterium striatum]HAT1475943.1 IclR family transcriptional regulator [Corynebacterium striatum]HCG2912396.1 IclR family transcriptional regulator [Corynebacterium striatum]HCG2972167.1 IclR family transcriptional regulator [Corynebacterium striatum]
MTKSRVPAARNVLAILRLLSTIDVPISASRIRSELDLPRSSTYHLLNEMVESGFVVHIEENQTYGLGLAAYSMASAYATQQPLVRLATNQLREIATVVGGSGHIARMSGSEIVYLQEVRSPGAVSLVTEKGVRLPAYKTASGKIMMAFQTDTEMRAAFSDNAASPHFSTFKKQVETLRSRGWAEEREEVSKGQATVAVAIQDHLNRPSAALAVTFSITEENLGKEDVVVGRLAVLAKELSRRIYGNGGD